MNTYKKVLFVCVGNTCRSPMAATIMQNCLKDTDILVDSRGMVVLFPEPYNPKAVAVAAKYGMIMPSNSAKQIDNKDFDSDTLVLVMNTAMKLKIYDIFDRAINVYTLGEFVKMPDEEVDDPYGRGTEAYCECFEHLKMLVEKAAQNILDNLRDNDNIAETDNNVL